MKLIYQGKTKDIYKVEELICLKMMSPVLMENLIQVLTKLAYQLLAWGN